LTKLKELKVELINKFEIESILLIGGAFGYVCLLACVYCSWKQLFRFTSSNLNVTSSTQWFTTNASNLQWKIEVGFIKSGEECWHVKSGWCVSWRFDEALLNYLESLPWNNAYIDEVKEVWWDSCWSSLECVSSTWINH